MTLAAIKGNQTVAELAKRFDLHAITIAQRKSQPLGNAATAFDGVNTSAVDPDLKWLHAKIGQHALEIAFLAGALDRIGDSSAKR